MKTISILFCTILLVTFSSLYACEYIPHLYNIHINLSGEPIVGEEEKKDHRPKITDLRLFCYPNPFTTEVSVKCSGISGIQRVSLKIYNMSGRLVKDLSLGTVHSSLVTALSWDSKDNSGKKVPSGVYFLEFEVGKYNTTRKVLKIR